MSKPAQTTIKSWEEWQSQPGSSPTSIPAPLPAVSPTRPAPVVSLDPAPAGSGTFTPSGTLTLPKRPAPGEEPTGTPISTDTSK